MKPNSIYVSALGRQRRRISEVSASSRIHASGAGRAMCDTVPTSQRDISAVVCARA
jgi:hypothetical protein